MGAIRTAPPDRRSGERRKNIDTADNVTEPMVYEKQPENTANHSRSLQAPKPKPRDRTSNTSTVSNQSRSNRPERKRHDTGGSQQMPLLGSGTSTDLSEMSRIVNDPLAISDISTHSGNHLLNAPSDNYNKNISAAAVPVPAQRTKRQQQRKSSVKIENNEYFDDRRESVT